MVFGLYLNKNLFVFFFFFVFKIFNPPCVGLAVISFIIQPIIAFILAELPLEFFYLFLWLIIIWVLGKSKEEHECNDECGTKKTWFSRLI